MVLTIFAVARPTTIVIGVRCPKREGKGKTWQQRTQRERTEGASGFAARTAALGLRTIPLVPPTMHVHYFHGPRINQYMHFAELHHIKLGISSSQERHELHKS